MEITFMVIGWVRVACLVLADRVEVMAVLPFAQNRVSSPTRCRRTCLKHVYEQNTPFREYSN